MMIAFAIVGVVLTVAGLVLIRNRYRSLVREKQAITSDLLGLTDGSTISPQNINELIDRVAATAETSQATLPAQVLRLLRHYQSRPNGQGVDAIVVALQRQNQLLLDQAIRPTRFLAWAVPVIGCLAMVVGVMVSILRFAGDVDASGDVEHMKQSLSDVTQGLATAFLPLIVYLVGALILSVLTVRLEGHYKRLIEQLNMWILQHVVAHLETDRPVLLVTSEP